MSETQRKRKRSRRWINSRDVCAVLGLGLVAGGLAMWHVPAALVTTGAILLALAVAGSVRRRPAATRVKQ